MFKPESYDDLCRAMQTGANVVLNGPDRLYSGFITAIEVEAGGGHCWNVTLQEVDGWGRPLFKKPTVFVRT